MATTANALRVIYRPHIASRQDGAIHPLLELALGQSNAEGVYLYRLSRENGSLDLIAYSGREPSDIPDFEVELPPTASQWHRENPMAVSLGSDAWKDWRYERFPEFLRNRFQAAVTIPVLDCGELAGIANIGRTAPVAFQAREFAFLRSLSLPLGALVARFDAQARLTGELEDLNRKLADRKLLERAKGVLQASHQWTEEQAYLYLRRTSRQRRTPMREIAGEIIATSAAGVSQ